MVPKKAIDFYPKNEEKIYPLYHRINVSPYMGNTLTEIVI
jgi:hypothetical protein